MSGLREHSVSFVTPFESNAGRMDAAKIRDKLVRPYPSTNLCLTNIDLIRGTFLSLYMNLLVLLLAGLKHFLLQIHLLHLRLTRFTVLKIAYRQKDLFSLTAAVQYRLSSAKQFGPN